jgi:hypothetical protein
MKREGGPSHNVGRSLLRVRPQVIQGPLEVEVELDAQGALAQMDEDGDLRNGVVIEVRRLQPVVVKKPAGK